MSCNCTSVQLLDALSGKYTESKEKEREKNSYRLKDDISDTIVKIEMVFIAPVIIIYVLYKVLMGEDKISIRKFLGQ